jgi:hypothetical protein
MSTFQAISATIGCIIIAVTLWQIAKNGIAKSNGKTPESDNGWFGGDGA